MALRGGNRRAGRRERCVSANAWAVCRLCTRRVSLRMTVLQRSCRADNLCRPLPEPVYHGNGRSCAGQRMTLQLGLPVGALVDCKQWHCLRGRRANKQPERRHQDPHRSQNEVAREENAPHIILRRERSGRERIASISRLSGKSEYLIN